MDKRKRNSLLFLILLVSTGAVVQAKETQPENQHSHDAHVHGDWELFAALDSKQLSITITAPLVDVIGFEHAPEDEKEHSAIGTLKARLQNPDLLFVLNRRAKCVLAKPALIVLPESFSDEGGHDDHDDHHHDNHKDDDDHTDHEGHAGHDDHHTDDHDNDTDHSGDHSGDHGDHSANLEVNYIFDCKSPARLRTITVTGFDTFSAIENVDAVFLSDKLQQADRLTHSSKILKTR